MEAIEKQLERGENKKYSIPQEQNKVNNGINNVYYSKIQLFNLSNKLTKVLQITTLNAIQKKIPYSTKTESQHQITIKL